MPRRTEPIWLEDPKGFLANIKPDVTYEVISHNENYNQAILGVRFHEGRAEVRPVDPNDLDALEERERFWQYIANAHSAVDIDYEVDRARGALRPIRRAVAPFEVRPRGEAPPAPVRERAASRIA